MGVPTEDVDYLDDIEGDWTDDDKVVPELKMVMGFVAYDQMLVRRKKLLARREEMRQILDGRLKPDPPFSEEDLARMRKELAWSTYRVMKEYMDAMTYLQFKKILSDKNRETHNQPHMRRIKARRMRARWRDPEYRERVREGMADPEVMEAYRKNGENLYERGLGIHARTKEEMSAHGKIFGKIGAKLANARRWTVPYLTQAAHRRLLTDGELSFLYSNMPDDEFIALCRDVIIPMLDKES